MSWGKAAVGILLFAAATAVLYGWGLKKAANQDQDLERILLSKCASKVMKYLRKHGTIDAQEMARLVTGVQAGTFWSKKRLSVQDPGLFARRLSRFLAEQQLIEETGGGHWRLRSK